MEDLDSLGQVKSKTALDFLIQLVPKIGVPPTLNSPPTITCPGNLTLVVGDTLDITISAADADPGQTVQLNVVGLPQGATMTPQVPIVGNPVSSTFSWTPTASQVGTTVVIFTARDSTGQQSLCAQTITVLAEAGPGRMTGGGAVTDSSGIKVTHGFQLHCSRKESPNNLEVNWDGGNNFHLENLTMSSCSDDPNIVPNQPAAAFDTYTGAGTGRYNGAPGATVQFIFTDAGEPGGNDSLKLVIKDSNGNIVLTASGKLNNGNHQAHDK